jgi:hypothetical protein
MCANGIVYRNQYCGMCNNNGSFQGFACTMFGTRFGIAKFSPDFRMLLNWHSLRERDTCWQDTEQYDPFQKTCRTAFLATESKSKLSALDLNLFVCTSCPLDWNVM